MRPSDGAPVVGPPPGVPKSGSPEATTSLLEGLVAKLGSCPSGIDFVYEALDVLSKEFSLDDAVIVLEDARLGRQLFRSGRLPVDAISFFGETRNAAPGLYTSPNGIDPVIAESVLHLCQIALQLDVRHHDASHDALTGLFNRRSFDALFQQSVSRSARYGWPFALALLDLDRFKAVNDLMGHDRGDKVLRVIGSELRRVLRGGDAAARIGGDEFAVIMSNGDAEAVRHLVLRLESAIGADLGVNVGFSAGVALAPSEATEPEVLYKLADRRLYEAKSA